MLDCVVVGAGPAGLATSRALTDRGVDHAVLERDRVGASWRSQRWESFRLNTPGWCNRLLGADQDADHFAARAEVISRLEALAAVAPVREHSAVTAVRPVAGGFELDTTGGVLRARTLVAATGDQNVPLIPPSAADLAPEVQQLHAAGYRAPGRLPPGGVLVVGSAQCGAQIAEDLRAAGRDVYLATSQVARLPWSYRGRATFDWLADAGFFDQRPADLPDPAMTRAPQPIVAAGGRSLSLRSLARTGVTLLGRLTAVRGHRISCSAGLAAAVAEGDAGAARLRAAIDGVIAARGLTAPVEEPDPDEELAPALPAPPPELDLRDRGIGAVVWCTGFAGDLSYLPAELLADDGSPRCDGAASIAPGLWFAGRKWLVRRDSGIMLGMDKDAVLVAGAVRDRLTAFAR